MTPKDSGEELPAPHPAQENSWFCDACGREADPLYYHDERQLCEACHTAFTRAAARPAA